ncbi:hypothetical protein DH09_19620 [Bacillaceae bacterium JMAK1]|nr:hypothetical protein DH09_19620 [Bacillaceae bacterium JMAK1]
MNNDLKILFGKKVRQVRLLAGEMTQEELAFACELHRTYVSDIERGKRNVSLDNIQKLATALNVTPKDLFEFSTLDTKD